MRERSLLFLQALWEADAEREAVQKLCAQAFLLDFDARTRGALHPSTLWVSEQAIRVREELLAVRQAVNEGLSPQQTLPLLKRYQDAMEQMQSLQARTARTLTASGGPRLGEIHILVRQLHPAARTALLQWAGMQLFRVLILCGPESAHRHPLPKGESLEEWLMFCRTQVRPLCDGAELSRLDGRWAYERRKVAFSGVLRVTQYISVEPKEEELRIPLGRTGLDTGADGSRRIYGRGYLTNLRPTDVFRVWGAPLEKQMPGRGCLAHIRTDTEDPILLLKRCFAGQRYLVSPEAFFALLNRFLLIRTFKDRSERGLCLFCGMPLYHGVCQKCGQRRS